MTKKTTVVHVNQGEYDVYIGRANRFKGLKSSIFANPFKLTDEHKRKDVISKYKAWFYAQIKSDPNFKEELLKLKGKRLACWCKPRACHGDVIAEYLNGTVAEPMKTLSIKQPYAEQILLGEKTIEYRTWRTHHRGDFLIHASKKPATNSFSDLDLANLDYGKIVGIVELVNVVGYPDGSYGWILENPRRIDPITHNGRLMFWDYAGEITISKRTSVEGSQEKNLKED